jgi:acetyl-CoA carboxylase biotin carboxyl carrier protein
MSDLRDNQGLPDLRYIRELAKVFRQFELDELEIENGDQRVLLRRSDLPARPPSEAVYAPASAQVAHAVAAPAPTPAPAPAPAETFITSPFVGTFYRSTSPESPAFTDVGATVQRGQTLCIVEAMKLFNELEAEFPCVIEAVLIDNAQPVEYGTRLFRVRKL